LPAVSVALQVVEETAKLVLAVMLVIVSVDEPVLVTVTVLTTLVP
jgi:hypothetical protein